MGGSCVPWADAACQKSERCCKEPACNRGDSSKLEIEQWTLPSLDPISWRTMLCSWHFSTTHKRQSRGSIAIHSARCDILVPLGFEVCRGEDKPLHSIKLFAHCKGFVLWTQLFCGKLTLTHHWHWVRCTLSASVPETAGAAGTLVLRQVMIGFCLKC